MLNENAVRVVQLTVTGQLEKALPCMGEAPSPWPHAVESSQSWMRSNLGSLILGLHLEDAVGRVIGHLYYSWSQHALVPYHIEEGVVVVLCEWVQRASQGRGYARDMMDALVQHLEDEECKGIVIAASDDEQCMHHRHYERRGFRELEAGGQMHLMYRPLRQQDIAVTPLRPVITPVKRRPVEILIFRGGMCPLESVTSLAALDVASEFGERVRIREVEPTRENVRALGVAGGTYVNCSRLPGGLSEPAVRRAILRALGDA
jgi:GNAT superfamily N-acetyltransferase